MHVGTQDVRRLGILVQDDLRRKERRVRAMRLCRGAKRIAACPASQVSVCHIDNKQVEQSQVASML